MKIASLFFVWKNMLPRNGLISFERATRREKGRGANRTLDN